MAGPRSDIARVIAAYNEASRVVLHDALVWEMEAAAVGGQPLAWPPQYAGTQQQRFLTFLFESDVLTMLAVLLATGDPLCPEIPPDQMDPKLQVVLRVAQRVVEAGERAITEQFGGTEGNGWRAYRNANNEELAAFAQRVATKSGAPLAEVYQNLGIEPRTAFRAKKRAVTRNRS